MAKRISRRQFLSHSAVTGAAVGVLSPSASQASNAPASPNPGPGAWVRWLDDRHSPVAQGVTWGTPWPRGKQRESKHFALRGADQKLHALQSWPLAYWPDGSLKFTAHALPPGADTGDGPFEVLPQRGSRNSAGVVVRESEAGIDIDTGLITARIARAGAHVIHSITRDGRQALRDGKLVLL